MIKFTQLSFLLGGIGVIANAQVTNTSVASTMVVVPTTSSPSITAAKTLGVPTTLLPTNTGPRKNFDLIIWIFIGLFTASILLLFLILLAYVVKHKQLKRKRKDKNEVQPLTKNDDISLHRTVDRDNFTSNDEMFNDECIHQEDDIKVTAMSNFSEEVLVHSTSAVPNKGVISSKVDSLELSGSKSKYAFSNYISVALENEDNPMCTLKEDLCKTDDKDPKRTYEKEDVQRSTPERDVSVGMSLRKTSIAKNVLDEYDPVITYGPTNAGSRFRSGSILDHPHNNLNSIAEENEKITVSEDGTAKLTKEQVRSDSTSSGSNIGSRCNLTNSKLDGSDVGENAGTPSNDPRASNITSENMCCDNITNVDEINPHPDTEREEFSSKNDLARSRETGHKTQHKLKKFCNKTDTLRPDHGGILQVDEIILNLAPGCLAEDTEITLIRDDHNLAFKTLVDLGLVVGSPRVVELLPDGLKFLKPADLTISFENNFADSELFILHGSYNPDYRRVVWELVTNEIQENMTKGVVTAKINGFCFYAFILAMRGVLARILSHLNHSFTSCAYAFYRRQPPMDKIDISVVVVSEFVDEYEENEIKQLKDHLKEGYVRSDKGMLKRVEIDHPLQVSLNFPGIEINTLVKVDQPELDSVGFVIDNFKGSAIAKPASGTVDICEVDHEDERRFLWKLNIHEMEQDKNEEEKDYVRSTKPEPETQVVYRTTKLTEKEIKQISTVYEQHWDELAGLMDIPYKEREKIRLKQVDPCLKAEEVFQLFNSTCDFDRQILAKCLDALELKNELPAFEDENGNEVASLAPPPIEDLGENNTKEVETQPLPTQDLDQGRIKEVETTETCDQNGTIDVETSPSSTAINADENEELKDIPLSPRELVRLSQRITIYWDPLAGEMGISSSKRDDIRNNGIYPDHRSRAEKILSIFNSSKSFSRKALANCLEGLQKFDLIEPIVTGEWRNL